MVIEEKKEEIERAVFMELPSNEICSYYEIKTKIEEYLKQELVTQSSSVISAFDLYQIVDGKFSELRRINQILSENEKRGLLDIFKGNRTFKFSKLFATNYGNKTEITFIPVRLSKDNKNICIVLEKDRNCEYMYYVNGSSKSKLIDDFVMKNYDYIMQIFKFAEDFSNYFTNITNLSQCNITYLIDNERAIFSKSQLVFDGYLGALVTYYANGEVDQKVIINPDKDTKEISKREWVKLQSITEILNQNKNELLKRFPVNIEVLDEPFKAIVEDNIFVKQQSEKDCKKPKQLTN